MPDIARPSEANVRLPVMAGRFYPDDPEECEREARSYLKGEPGIRGKLLGGIVPHAGWICSGAIAGQTIATLAADQPKPDIVVVFGAIHSPYETVRGELDSHQKWDEPTGESELPEALQAQLTQSTLFGVDERFHENEHAVEVELPLIQLAWPKAKVLPIEVPPIGQAMDIGREVARRMQREKVKAVYLASSDLTHYGPSYRFTPAGVGESAMQWAKDNDRRLLDKVERMEIEQIVPEARSRLSACGAGAIAAMLAACRESGASNAKLLRHANSYETLRDVGYPQRPTDAVGYASVVVSGD